MNIMEIRDCEGYPGFRVSDTGEVFKGDEPVMAYYSLGYVRVSLRNTKNHYKSESIHRLVVTAFKGAITRGMFIDHVNGIKDDNRLENLEVVTPRENNLRRYRLKKREKTLQMESEYFQGLTNYLKRFVSKE